MTTSQIFTSSAHQPYLSFSYNQGIYFFPRSFGLLPRQKIAQNINVGVVVLMGTNPGWSWNEDPGGSSKPFRKRGPVLPNLTRKRAAILLKASVCRCQATPTQRRILEKSANGLLARLR